MTDATLPVLYSFRRCPYAMRARLALAVSSQRCVLREIALKDKPEEMRAVSPKATVPVLVMPDGNVLKESLDIMEWALNRNDPEHWLAPEIGNLDDMKELIARNDGPFKDHLDRYKYATRYDPLTDPLYHREQGAIILRSLEERLTSRAQLFGDRPALADIAVFPFIRQYAHTDRDWFDIQPWPHLQNWLTDHLESELFAAIMTKWTIWSPGDPDIVFPAAPPI